LPDLQPIDTPVFPPNRPGWRRWLVDSAVARIVIFAAFLTGTTLLAGSLANALGLRETTPAQAALASPWRVLLMIAAAVIAYALLVRGIERRRIVELAPRRLVGFTAGLLLGVALFSLVVAVLWLTGSYRVTGFNHNLPWLPLILVMGISPGVIEEIICRGVLFRIVEEGLGTWAALAISALFFGAAHIFNPGATLWSSLAIAIEAGLMLGMMYQVTRSLWACMGLHAAWNLMQGPVYGIAVSGLTQKGWIIPTMTGPDWLTGGGFGAEASVPALICCSALTAVLLVIAVRRGTIVPFRRARRLP
jgi:membrane protease YdiL (CAAX protease family)